MNGGKRRQCNRGGRALGEREPAVEVKSAKEDEIREELPPKTAGDKDRGTAVM